MKSTNHHNLVSQRNTNETSVLKRKKIYKLADKRKTKFEEYQSSNSKSIWFQAKQNKKTNNNTQKTKHKPTKMGMHKGSPEKQVVPATT